jgi:hypothetical protein
LRGADDLYRTRAGGDQQAPDNRTKGWMHGRVTS